MSVHSQMEAEMAADLKKVDGQAESEMSKLFDQEIAAEHQIREARMQAAMHELEYLKKPDASHPTTAPSPGERTAAGGAAKLKQDSVESQKLAASNDIQGLTEGQEKQGAGLAGRADDGVDPELKVLGLMQRKEAAAEDEVRRQFAAKMDAVKSVARAEDRAIFRWAGGWGLRAGPSCCSRHGTVKRPLRARRLGRGADTRRGGSHYAKEAGMTFPGELKVHGLEQVTTGPAHILPVL